MISTEPFEWMIIKSNLLKLENDVRLDPIFYSNDRIKANIIIEKLRESGIEIRRIGDKSLSNKIFWPGRFKRKYTSKEYGKPFLTPAEVFMFFPKPRKFVVDFPENVLIDNNWILITRSGSIGRTIISNKILSSYVISDDILRLIPKDNSLLGYLYAYLNTWIGQAFLTKSKYGATVKHIEPKHVADIPVPLLPESDIREINNDILRAHRLREEAQKLLISAEEMFYRELNLPKIDKPYEEYLGEGEEKIVKAFTIRASMLDLRLDATYYMPSIKSLIDLIEKSTTGYLSNLGRITNRIFVPNRFKRIYVKDSQIGVPFLQGSHIPMVRLFDIKYISRNMKNIEKITLKKDWILITRSGTVGRVVLVTDYWNGWAGSEHLLRLVISNDVLPGYVLAFLLSSYGYYQIVAKVYGGVVDEIAEQDVSLIKEIKIIIPYDDSIQRKIHKLIRDAFSKKDKAIMIENAAIEKLERLLVEYSK